MPNGVVRTSPYFLNLILVLNSEYSNASKDDVLGIINKDYGNWVGSRCIHVFRSEKTYNQYLKYGFEGMSDKDLDDTITIGY